MNVRSMIVSVVVAGGLLTGCGSDSDEPEADVEVSEEPAVIEETESPNETEPVETPDTTTPDGEAPEGEASEGEASEGDGVAVKTGSVEQFCASYASLNDYEIPADTDNPFWEIRELYVEVVYPEELVSEAETVFNGLFAVATEIDAVNAAGNAGEYQSAEGLFLETEEEADRIESFYKENCETN